MVSNRKEKSLDKPTKTFGQGDYGSEEDIEGGSLMEKGSFSVSKGFVLSEDPWADFILSAY